jgi:hypothetical protein
MVVVELPFLEGGGSWMREEVLSVDLVCVVERKLGKLLRGAGSMK